MLPLKASDDMLLRITGTPQALATLTSATVSFVSLSLID